MNDQSITYREYRDGDYSACESLVANAWKFDDIFSPQALADMAKFLYTMGSVAGSNFRLVAEAGNTVIGFIFGFNEAIPLQKHEIHKVSSRICILIRLLFMQNWTLKGKRAFLKTLGTHETNRSAVLKRGSSEVMLFVVHPAQQGKGIGKTLFSRFRDFCEKSNVPFVIVETNKLEASSFYERVGFRHLGDFDSPLHRYATPNGQACLYKYDVKKER